MFFQKKKLPFRSILVNYRDEESSENYLLFYFRNNPFGKINEN